VLYGDIAAYERVAMQSVDHARGTRRSAPPTGKLRKAFAKHKETIAKV
jgi:hypothetical protein